MPHAKRDSQKRDLAQAIAALQKGAGHLSDMYSLYKPVHPELAEALGVAVVGTGEIVELLLRFWEKAWGKRPTDLDSWLGR